MELNKGNKFAAFIMTFEREHILSDTINKILSQTFPPQKILIIDNSFSDKTELLVNSLQYQNVFYHRVGYNSGPAGAAAIGLKLLANEGFEWIYWGDDDDPPVFEDTFEILLRTAMSINNCGCVGSVGQYFNRKTGLIKRVSNEEIENEGIIEVDTIAGGMSKIVNGPMVRKLEILPDERLFFSFEDLDIDIKIRKAGYKILADKSLYLRHRLHFNRINALSRKGLKKSETALVRDYYSMRNCLTILFKNKLYIAFAVTILRFLFKIGLGFKYGIKYGISNAKVVITAINHFVSGKRGKVLFEI
ncbi:MAG: glycosyltransferase [Flavobacterium sp.]